MSWADSAWNTQSNLRQLSQLVPPTYVSPTAGWYSPNQPVAPTYESSGIEAPGGVRTGMSAILGAANPILGVISMIAGIMGGQKEKERMRRAEEKRRALEIASWASENYKNAGWGGY